MFYGSDNFSVGVGLSIASPNHHTSRYMADQTFHTPNFGDEEFDIPPMNHPSDQGHHQQQQQQQQQQQHVQYSMPMGHGGPGDHQGGHHYGSMYLPEHMSPPISMHSPLNYGGSPPTYTTLSSPHSASQSPMGNQHMMHHHQQPQQQPNRGPQTSMVPPNGPPGRSPTNSNPSPANPEATTSEDSDDSVPVAQMTAGMKRPSPEPVDSRPPVTVVKKPKAQKKKKKRDPNEPQKPVSAYALFFRDTQAAIKGQNPNASFGEVSKIVASMWDALDADHKNVYKKKTEAAKKEYLKALAAYRASLVSKGASPDSDPTGMYAPPSFNTNMPVQQHYAQNTSYYGNQGPTGHGSPGVGGKKSQQSMQPPQQRPQSQPSPSHQQASPQQQSHQGHGMMGQMNPGGHMVDTSQYGQMRHNTGYMNPMVDSHGMMANQMHMQSQGPHGQMQPGTGPMGHMQQDSHNHNRQMCVRNGCGNASMTNSEWDEEYCSNDCVVTHCRNVFTNWVSSNQQASPGYGNSVKFHHPPGSGSLGGADGIPYVT